MDPKMHVIDHPILLPPFSANYTRLQYPELSLAVFPHSGLFKQHQSYRLDPLDAVRFFGPLYSGDQPRVSRFLLPYKM